MEGQELLKLQNIQVTPNKWYSSFLPNNLLQEVGIQDGHVFLRAAIGAFNLFRNSSNPSYSNVDLQQYLLPFLPIAYDQNTGKIYLGENYDEITATQNPQIQKITTTSEIYENKQFPQLIKLSEIFQLIQDLAKISELKKKNGETSNEPSNIEKAISSIVFHLNTIPDEIKYPNFYAKFHGDLNKTFSLRVETQGLQKIEKIDSNGQLNLDEIFIPGILHLERTQADFHLKYLAGQESQIDLENIHANLKPMDFLKDNPRKLGMLQIKGGEVNDGEAVEYMGFNFPPGIHIQQIGSDTVQLQANLKINMTLFIPFFGDIEIKAPFIFETQIKADPLKLLSNNPDQKIKFLPQSTVFFMPDFQVQVGKNSQTQLYETNLLITDIPSLEIPSHYYYSTESGFWMSLDILQASNSPIQKGILEMFLPIKIDNCGSYQLGDLRKDLNLNAFVNLQIQDEQNISGNIDWMNITKEDIFEANLRTTLNRYNTNGKELKPLAKAFSFNIIETSSEGNLQHNVSLDANFLDLGFLELSHPQVNFYSTTSRQADGSLVCTVHDFQIQANKNQSEFKPNGIIQGPFSIKTIKAKKGLQISFDPNTHRAQLQNLGIRFDVKKITLPGLWESTHHGISGIDLDGLLLGNWDFNTETYAGKGYLALRGDKEGDVHFRGKNGRRLEAVLDPNEPNRYYEIPLLADTRFVIDRIQAVDTKNEQLRGHFHLSTLVDWLALKAVGIQWNEHDEFVFDFDHLPYSKKGYAHKIREFFTYIATHPPKISHSSGEVKP